MKAAPYKVLAGAAVLSLALSACSSNNGGGTTSPSASKTNEGAVFAADYNKQDYANLKDGGTLSMAIAEITPQLNVFESNMTSDTSTIWGWYNPQLIGFEANGDVVLNSNYLTSAKAEVKDGKTVVTYVINDKAVFNDGTPIDWTAFENTWKANNGSQDGFEANSTDGFTLIESVAKGATDKTAVVTFKQEYAWWAGLFNILLHPSINTADEFTNAYTGGTTASAHPELGAGPYKLESLDQTAGTITFVKNEKWWGNPGKLDKITINQRDSQASLNAFLNGEIDYTSASSAERLSQVKSMTGVEIRRGATPAIFMITQNSGSAALSDVKVREAIATAVDREQIAAVQFNGLDYTEEPPGSIVLYPYQTGYENVFGTLVPKTDTAAADKLLDEAGWTKGADGIRTKNGAALTLRLPIFSDAQLTRARAQALQAQLKTVGINLDVQQRTSQEFSTVINSGDFDLLISGFRSTDPFGVAYYCQIYCSDSSLNNSGTGNAALDAEITKLEAIADPTAQIAKANELEETALGTFGLVPLFSGVTIYAAKDGLANVGAGVFATDGNGLSLFRENIGWEK